MTTISVWLLIITTHVQAGTVTAIQPVQFYTAEECNRIALVAKETNARVRNYDEFAYQCISAQVAKPWK